MQANPSKIDKSALNLLVQGVNVLIEQNRLWQIVSVVNASILCWVAYFLSHYDFDGIVRLAVWWGFLTLIAMIRWIIATRYLALTEEARLANIYRHRHKARIGAGISGLVWAIGAYLMLGNGNVLDLFTVFVAATMIAGALSSLASDKIAYYVYTCPIVFSVVIGLISDDPLNIAFVIMILFFLVVASRSAHFFYTALWRSIQLEDEKSKLIDDLKNAKEIAETANRAKTEFLANISHELRTPLNGIVGMSELIALEALTDEQKSYMDSLQLSTAQLHKLIEYMIELATIEAGEYRIEKTSFEHAKWRAHILAKLEKEAVPKGLSFQIQKPENLPRLLEGDPKCIHRILLQLIDNAIKFTERGEIIIAINALSRTAEKITLEFSVKDTGIGIPENQINAVTGLFVQVDGSISRRYGGIGLGLPIANKLVELLGSELLIQSKLGKGSTFSFELSFPIVAE